MFFHLLLWQTEAEGRDKLKTLHIWYIDKYVYLSVYLLSLQEINISRINISRINISRPSEIGLSALQEARAGLGYHFSFISSPSFLCSCPPSNHVHLLFCLWTSRLKASALAVSSSDEPVSDPHFAGFSPTSRLLATMSSPQTDLSVHLS